MQKTTYVWDELSDNVIEEYEDGVLSVSYDHEPGLYGNLLSQNRNGVTSYYHYDGRGDTVALTDNAGNVTDTKEYDAWGNVIASTGSTLTPYQFGARQGYQKHQNMDVIYGRSRYLSMSSGRWNSVELAGLIFGTNGFVYVNNAPIRSTNPSGFTRFTQAASLQRTDSPDTRPLGCNDLAPAERDFLSTCNPGGEPCSCGVLDDPDKQHLHPLNNNAIAAVVCKDGKPDVGFNSAPWFVRGLYEWQWAGIYRCLVAHEKHHVAQYMCFCPDVCKGKKDGLAATLNINCSNTAECYAYIGQLNCMIGVACQAFKAGDPSHKERFNFIMQQLDAFYADNALSYCNPIGVDVELNIKNMKNWELLRHGKPCRGLF